MKFRNQARLCLDILDFEAHIMLSICLAFQSARLPVWKQFNSILWLRSVNLFSDFY